MLLREEPHQQKANVRPQRSGPNPYGIALLAAALVVGYYGFGVKKVTEAKDTVQENKQNPAKRVSVP
ncbi:hypothetical protein BZG36_01849 [Bifiguratus adelaidae]|uniref:Uncharacterized protein n=1 Tax=Bifiguratus adelaidae TaxID=1938954 RepID=A0A261Y2P5_9FUNG|nr:hypothetical protein BZG36_01849 [Bifiguratus adelaidae]